MIIVTGASRGLGRAVCERLLAKQVPVLGLARQIVSVPFDARSCDVSSYDEVRAVAHDLRREHKHVLGLINAAGIAAMNLALTTPPEVAQRIIATNLLGSIYCCQLFSPLMVRGRRGAIVNFSTVAVPLGLKGESIYVASKSGVEGISRAFAREMADFGITVNCIAPGPINTELLKGVSQEQIRDIISRQIIPKQFDVSDVCDLVEFVTLDPRSRSLSGEVLHVGGI